MYDLYSMERPGRPWLAVALTAAILAGTVVFAELIVVQKQRTIYVSLGEATPIGSWPISIRPPVGWKVEPPTNAPPQVGLVFVEPAGFGRALAVVQGPMMQSALPASYAVATLEDAVLWFSGSDMPKLITQKPVPFGPLPGVEVQWIIGYRRQSLKRILGCVTVTPQGRVFALLLKCPGRIDRNDERFLEHVAATVKLADLNTTDDIAAAARACGLRLGPPSEAMAAPFPDGPVPTLQVICRPDAEKPWTLEITVVPLAPERTPQAVLSDIVRNLTEQVQPAAEIETIQLGSHTAGRVRFETPDQPWDGELWTVPLDARHVAVLVGHADESGSDLPAVCEQIARTLQFADDARPIDTTAAQRRGADLLARIRDKRVDAWFDEWAASTQFYLIMRDAQIEGYYRLGYTRLADEEDRPWQVVSELHRQLSEGQTITYKREARLDPGGAGYELAEVRRTGARGRRPRGRMDTPYQYHEGRAAGANRVHKALQIGAASYENTFTVDASFACDPVLGIVSWLAASDTERRPVLVVTSDRFEVAWATQVLYPLGPQSVPGSEPPRTAPALVVQTDSLPYVYTMYFDQDGTLLCVDFGRGTIFRRCTEEEFRENLSLTPGLSIVPAR